MHCTEQYQHPSGVSRKVLVSKITSPDQVLAAGPGSIHQSLASEGLGNAVGLYFYRFKDLEHRGAFTKIGEVSREGGVRVRKQRGWLAPPSYGGSYLTPNTAGQKKGVHEDVLAITPADQMYFVFYEFDVELSFPKIDEIAAFARHVQHFGRSTRNIDRVNTFERLGRRLVWRAEAFAEVLALRLPSGRGYAEALATR